MMRRSAALLLFVGFHAAFLWAASPESAPEPVLTFRVETGEVHLVFAAVENHVNPVTQLAADDFVLLRDGEPISRFSTFQRYQDVPLEAAVVTDVSESMRRSVSVVTLAKSWMASHGVHPDDRVSFVEFGARREGKGDSSSVNPHMTGLYDALYRVMQPGNSPAGYRRAVILFSDCEDNYSIRSLREVIDLAQRTETALYVVNVVDRHSENNNEDTMRLLTESTGGHLFTVKNGRQAVVAVQQIEAELRNGFVLTFRADASRSGTHRLSMHSTGRPLEFFHRTTYYQPPLGVAQRGSEIATSAPH